MNYIVLFMASLFMTSYVYASSVSAESMNSLASAMNERMSMMKDVAGYKAENHLPVEDLTREKNVITSAQEAATEAGLDPQSVLPFIHAQMDVAKAIQYRYLAQWLSCPEPYWKPEKLEDVRRIISEQDKAVLNIISQRLIAGGFNDTDKSEMISLINSPHLSEQDKFRLVKTMAVITRMK